jgi:hypothetical protein
MTRLLLALVAWKFYFLILAITIFWPGLVIALFKNTLPKIKREREKKLRAATKSGLRKERKFSLSKET